ncbi:MAG: substrate-binding domain-containing protein [Coriobacteriia bacterium]|nr:substrate-binding domain-containing protein [Coriobacteriia bacterium]
MRRRAYLALFALVILVLIGGCTSSVDSGTDASVAATGEQLRISGSGTCLPLVHILSEEYPGNAEFVYLPGLHSGGGIEGVANGDLEIGAVSRELSEDEAALGLDYVALSDDGLVIAVHPSVTIDGLTTQQVRDIYAGKYSDWAELGGEDAPITILDRNEDESAKIILRQYVLGSDLEITPKAVNLYYESDMIEGLQSTVGAIGYFSLGQGLSQDVPVRYLELDGVAATVDNILNGSYKMVRPLGVVTASTPSADIAAFLEWATSSEVAELMKSRGFAPAK